MGMDEDLEKAAKAIYALDPFYESGEYVDGHLVSPGGHLSWKQAQARDVEFGEDPRMGKVTEFAYKAAAAALEAVGLYRPLDCTGVKEMPFTHLFIGEPAQCARCGLMEAEYKPWTRCPSTHCERRGECASPSDCIVKRPRDV